MAAGCIRALRYFPYNSYLRQIEPIIDELMEYRPVLLLDARKGPPNTEILEFGARFLDLPMVLMQTIGRSRCNWWT